MKINSKIQIKKGNLILFCGAIFVFVWLLIINLIKGPQWIMGSDLGYTYLLNGLNILLGIEIGVLIHPAITVSYFYATIIYFYHSFFGTGELQSHVISNAELYSIVLNTLTYLGISFGCFFLGSCVYKITKKISYSLLVILSILAIQVEDLPNAANAGPESLLLIFIPIIAGICFLKANNSCTQKLFVFVSAIVCAMSIGAKFISIPIIILPFLVSKGFKEKREFLLAFFLSLGVVFMPIYLNPQHLNTFKFAMSGLADSISLERNSFQSENQILKAISYFLQTSSEMKVFFGFFIAQFSIFPFVRPKLFQKYPDLFKISLFNFKLLISLLLAVIFISIRPKTNYFLIFISFQTLGIILSIFLLRRNIEIKSKKSLIHN